MKTPALIATALAAAVTLGALPAMAQPGNGPQDELVRPGAAKSRNARPTPPGLERREINRETNRERYLERHEHFNARGPAFRPGLRIPPLFLHPSYVVIDYRLHRLPPPPRGHQWVQVGPDYVLVVIGTGVIVQIVLGF